MCEPTTIMMVMAAASVAITAGSEAVAADSQRRSGNQQRDATLANMHAQDASMQVQQYQVDQQASQQMGQRAVEAMRERGRLAAVFADSGAGGNSQGRIFNAAGVAEGADMATIESNRAAQIAQGQDQKTTIDRSGRQTIDAIKMPSLLGSGLRIASSAVSAASYVQNASANQPTNKAPRG